MSLEHIAEGLRTLAVPIDGLAVDDNNARSHNDRNLSAIKTSLTRFGQRQPLVVQKQGMVVRAGNGRLAIAKELGWTHVAAIVVDENDAEAAAYALADNRSGELAEWDLGTLATTLEHLDVALPDFSARDLGWSQMEIDGLKMATSWDDAIERADIYPPKDPEDSRAQPDRSYPKILDDLVLRFDKEQQEELEDYHKQVKFEGDITSDSILALIRLVASQ
jgi:ParB-like chromosome segregation protein Spo0J